MSRIGNKVIEIPSTVTILVEGNHVTVKGPKGTLDDHFNEHISYKTEGNEFHVLRESDAYKMIHGTTRALINSMVVGVSEGFEKVLDIVGIGYRAAMRGANLVLTIGYSHEVVIAPLEGVTISLANPNEVHIQGANKQHVGQTAAVIRAVREPEPYLGKGIKYREEHILRKEGKRASKK